MIRLLIILFFLPIISTGQLPSMIGFTHSGGGSPPPPSITLVVETGKASTNGGAVTTDAINTTGANLIVIGVSSVNGTALTIVDSKSNTWTPLTEYVSVVEAVKVRLFYCYSPTVGTNHTFATGGTNFPNIHLFAFSNTTGDFDAENGSNGASPLATGTVTPATNGQVIISLLGANFTSSISAITAEFTNTDQASVSNGSFFNSMAYYIQPTAGAQGCTFTWTASAGGNLGASTIATFK